MKTLLCIGLGYSARAVCRRLPPSDWRIMGTSRSADGVAQIGIAGWHGIRYDGSGPSAEVAAALQAATHLLVSAAPTDGADPLLRQHARDVANARALETIVYLSTIGVYGDHQGRWIDEGAALAAQSERGRARIIAEAAWQNLAQAAGKRLTLLRLSGIYGPGRNTFEALLAGNCRRIIKPGQVFNRIHVDDIATSTLAALTDQRFQGAVNVTDDEPAPPQDVIAHAAALLGVNPPPEIPFDQAELTPMARSFYGDNKRVANRRLTVELAIRLAHPTYREGLAALLPDLRTRSPR